MKINVIECRGVTGRLTDRQTVRIKPYACSSYDSDSWRNYTYYSDLLFWEALSWFQKLPRLVFEAMPIRWSSDDWWKPKKLEEISEVGEESRMIYEGWWRDDWQGRTKGGVFRTIVNCSDRVQTFAVDDSSHRLPQNHQNKTLFETNPQCASRYSAPMTALIAAVKA